MESPAEYLIGVRLHESAQADDYKLVDLDAHVGDLVMVETAANGTAIGEVRRPRRELPESKRDRLYRRVVRIASEPRSEGTRLNSSHGYISYAVFCLKKKKNTESK